MIRYTVPVRRRGVLFGAQSLFEKWFCVYTGIEYQITQGPSIKSVK